MSAQTSSHPLDRLDHIAVAVTDVAAAADWYRETFRCEIEYLDPTWALLRFRNVRLALVVSRQHPPHIAIQREDAERFGKLATHRDGSRSIYVTDVDGNAVEVIEPYAGMRASK